MKTENQKRVDRVLLEKYLKQSSHLLSSYSFVQLDIWQDFFNFELLEINKTLSVIASDKTSVFLYLPPLGKSINAHVLSEVSNYVSENYPTKTGFRVEHVDAQSVTFFESLSWTIQPRGQEYIYYKDDLIAFRGHEYKSKRHDIHLFEKKYKFVCTSFNDSMTEACLKLYDKWQKNRLRVQRDDMYRFMMEDSRQAQIVAMRDWKSLGLVSKVIWVDGKVVAYTFGYPINKELFCSLFEIADPSIEGVGTFVFHELCADEAVSSYKFINAMDDFGLDNLRRAKMSYRPTIVAPLFCAIPQKG